MSLSVPDQSTRNRPDSTGDSGLPEHEHKRPRLSDCPSDEESVLITNSSSGHEVPGSSSQPLLNNKDNVISALNISPPSPVPNTAPSVATSPTSKVTINTRPISSQSSTYPTATTMSNGEPSGDYSHRPDAASPTPQSAKTMEQSTQMENYQPETISISSSETESPPPIQIAAPEDFDQDPSETKWRPMSENTSTEQASLGADHIHRTFPFAHRYRIGAAHNILPNMVTIFQYGGQGDGELLKQIKTWLLELTTQVSTIEYSIFASEPDFWVQLPQLVTGLIRREVEPPTGVQAQDLVDFFVAFARLTKLVTDAEVQRFQSYPDTVDGRSVKIALTLEYLNPLHWSMQPNGIPLYAMSHGTNTYDPSLIAGSIVDALLQSGGVDLIGSMGELFDALAAFIPRKPAIATQVISLLQHAQLFIQIFASRLGISEDSEQLDRVRKDTLRSACQQYLLKANAALERAVVKQHAWLTIENCEQILKHFEQFIKALVQVLPELASEIVASAGVDPINFADEELPALSIPAWKFMTLRKFIKSGRMELRVFGIGAMAEDLVRVFKTHIQPPVSKLDHPTVRLLASFIRDNELIRYIIGVDSHPQIINRSTNVVGFLCVSRKFQNEDIDVIWRTALECQDPRAGLEVLLVLQNTFENLDLRLLEHVVQKLLELPFDRYTMQIFDFAWKLLQVTNWKLETEATRTNDAMVLNAISGRLCLKLLCEGHAPQRSSTDLANRIRHCIPDQLENRLKPLGQRGDFGISPDDLQFMVGDLCSNIRDHNPLSCGSILALMCILSSIDRRLSVELIQQYDLIRLIVEDTIRFLRSMNGEEEIKLRWVEHECRISSLPLLILHSANSFTEILLDQIWLNLLSTNSISSYVRTFTWSNLARVCESCNNQNSVLETLVNTYLPRLLPSEYDKAVLAFIEQSVKYETRLYPPEPLETGVVSIPGMERVWQVMLRAPPNSVESQASEFIISEYLDGTSITSLPLQVIEATHLNLIDRCVQQAINTAAQLKSIKQSDMAEDTPTGINDSSIDPTMLDLQFHRSLFFLRKFLNALKSRPRYVPSSRTDVKQLLKHFKPKGVSFELSLQIHNHRSLEGSPQKWTVGQDNTASEVWQFVSDITGWTHFIVIYRGAKVDYKDQKATLKELNVTTGMLMVSKVAGSPEVTPSRAVRASSPVDSKVMHHFHDLYSLLDLENGLAQEVYEFLTMFSSQQAMLEKLRSTSIPASELLPVEKPYKLMYYARALRSCIEEESFSVSPNTDFLIYAVRTIENSLTQSDRLQADLNLRSSITHGLLEALLLAFRAKVPVEVSGAYIADPNTFVRQILTLWYQIQELASPDACRHPLPAMIRAPFEVLLEASLHDKRLWSCLATDSFSELLSKTLLKYSNIDVRQTLLEVVYGLTGTPVTKTGLKLNDPRSPRARFSSQALEDCMTRLWQFLADLVPDACECANNCQQFFEAASSLLRVVGKKMDANQLRAYVEQWRPLLLAHEHKQNIGHPLKDYVVFSIGKLLLECFKLRPELGDELSSGTFSHDLFSRFLFPPLSVGGVGGIQQIPVLDMHVRQVLYDLVLAVSHTRSGLENISSELSGDLVPKDYFFQPFVSNERQILRSEVGYAGLRNLSNTCYLNSLFTQLFMNVEFRNLVLNIEIVDESRQKLVVELSKVFAHMQSSFEDAVTPETAVDAITQWDGDQIDVTVQMDVDEFFNLLFDRLEFQILDPKVRSYFKSIYGGQLVQQIKSKECEHVSERLEPFSAVQVEIKGKASLEESLKAYVEGEVLQGENKYSCTGCGKHVDAVKRACLKDIPDHLIFNLKRFDYDIMTGMRCKVNDEFQFPNTIDIAPYALEALSNPDGAVEPDMFELVGIIIHSGTAESGHYYSYIRQRPSQKGVSDSWVQFNDHDVTRFDPASIRDCCFGGIDFGAVQCPKFYNGYMLFYQRSSSIQQLEKTYTQHDLVSPVRIPLPDDFENHISQQNELYLRSHVAQSPVHAKFIKQLLQQLPANEVQECSLDHELESLIFNVALDYINQLSARWKELPDVEDTMKTLELYASQCEVCAEFVVQWFLKDANLTDNIIRSCYQAVRKSCLNLLMTCWQTLAEHKQRIKSEQSLDDDPYRTNSYERMLVEFLAVMASGWDALQRYGRSWEQYFMLLSFLLKLGDEEACIVIEEGFLERAIELVLVHVPHQSIMKKLRQKYTTYLVQRERNRLFMHGNLIQFVAEVLQHVALDAPWNSPHSRAQVGDRFGLLPHEAGLMGLQANSSSMTWLKRIIIGGHNVPAMVVIVATISKVTKMNHALSESLKEGLAEPNILHAVSFLRPALIYFENAVDEDILARAVENALELIESTGGSYGKEFLTFVQHVGQLENTGLLSQRGFLVQNVYNTIKHWAPVLLMHPNEMHADVRGETVDYLNEILFMVLDSARGSDPQKYHTWLGLVLELLEACARYAQRTFLEPSPKERMVLQAGQANQVLTIADNYLPLFTNNADEEDRAARVTLVMDDLRLKSEGIIETMSSVEWKDASSDLEALSEVELSELSP